MCSLSGTLLLQKMRRESYASRCSESCIFLAKNAAKTAGGRFFLADLWVLLGVNRSGRLGFQPRRNPIRLLFKINPQQDVIPDGSHQQSGTEGVSGMI